MKNYGALRVIAFILKAIGWLIMVSAAFILIAGLSPSAMAGVYNATGSVLTALATAISGLLVLASGEAISALVDIAMNSAKIEHHSARTVEFIERMDTNRRAQ